MRLAALAIAAALTTSPALAESASQAWAEIKTKVGSSAELCGEAFGRLAGSIAGQAAVDEIEDAILNANMRCVGAGKIAGSIDAGAPLPAKAQEHVAAAVDSLSDGYRTAVEAIAVAEEIAEGNEARLSQFQELSDRATEALDAAEYRLLLAQGAVGAAR